MPKFFVVFTEESTKDHGYYVEASDSQDAYMKAEEKYFDHEEADSVSTGYSKTLGHEVINA
jgi:hypothetical protein